MTSGGCHRGIAQAGRGRGEPRHRADLRRRRLLDFLNAFEVLERLGARATLYVPVSSVGVRVLRWDRGHSRLGWDEIRHLSQSGVEIGSQSVQNRPLDVCPDAAVRDEVIESRRILEDELVLPIKSFCYPVGLTSSRVRRAVADAGYTNACTIGAPRPGHADDLLRLPRIRVRSRTTPEKLGALVGRGGTDGITTYLAHAAKPGMQIASRPARRALHIALRRR